MHDITSILTAKAPLMLAAVVRGAQPLVMADLARAAHHAAKGEGRAVFIAVNDAAMSSVAEAAGFFAPELDVIEFPAWDCLPYDRASPALSVSARRLSAMHRLQSTHQEPQLLVTTVNAVLQRVLTPFRIRESVRLFEPGLEIGRDSLIALLRRQGYLRSDTAVDAGDFAVRGSIFDIVPSGLDAGLRLDFFGDDLKRCGCSIPTPSDRPDRLSGTCCFPRVKRCSTRNRSSAFAAAIANSSAPRPPRTRSTRRSATAGGSPGWNTGCRCSKTVW